jgi:hypothetical protein
VGDRGVRSSRASVNAKRTPEISNPIRKLHRRGDGRRRLGNIRARTKEAPAPVRHTQGSARSRATHGMATSARQRNPRHRRLNVGYFVSQRGSGYERKALDQYETPPWVTLALIPHLPAPPLRIWERAAGSGKMVAALRVGGYVVEASDIAQQGCDFLTTTGTRDCNAVVTNPPYTLAQQFIAHALNLEGVQIVAMLLRCDFDHAKTRQHLFADCPTFAKKIVLTKRIRWFEDSCGSPSFNHAWFVWDRQHQGLPTLAYAPAA